MQRMLQGLRGIKKGVIFYRLVSCFIPVEIFQMMISQRVSFQLAYKSELELHVESRMVVKFQ